MVQIIENWTDLTGVITGIAPCAAHDGFVNITISVERADAVGAFANLLAARAGGPVDVRVRAADAPRFAVHTKVTIRARLAPGNAIFAHPAPVS